MEITQSNISGLTTGYKVAFNKQLEDTKIVYEQFTTKIQSQTKYEDYPFLGQMPGMKEWIGDREIQNFESNNYIVANKSYEDTIAINRDDIEDDQYGKYKPVIQGFADAAARLPQELTVKAMIGGFANKCYDGKAFFATDHKMGKNVYSNRSTEKLSRIAFRRGRTAMRSLVGDKGRALGIVPDLLVVSPTNEYVGREILEEDRLENGASNPDKGLARLLVLDELATDPDVWFLFCTGKFLKPMIYQERKKPTFTYLTGDKDLNVFMSNKYIYGADARGAAAYGFPQMAYGSTGETNAQG